MQHGAHGTWEITDANDICDICLQAAGDMSCVHVYLLVLQHDDRTESTVNSVHGGGGQL